MIPLEKQVTSLEPSKRLKELGVKQDSIFWWVKHIKSGTNHYIWDLVYGKDENDSVNEYISAFSVAELGEMLPFNYIALKHISIEKWFGVEFFMGGSAKSIDIGAKTEADARAKMLIYLIENELVEGK